MNKNTTINSPDLHVKITWQQDRVSVAVTGEVDLTTATRLSAALNKVIVNSSRSVEVDLSETSFSACSGLSVLTAAHQ